MIEIVELLLYCFGGPIDMGTQDYGIYLIVTQWCLVFFS